MNGTDRTNQRSPREWHGTHSPWNYRPHAFRWIGEQIVGINFLPLAKDMRAWLMQRGSLPIASTTDQRAEGAYTKPELLDRFWPQYHYDRNGTWLDMCSIIGNY